MVDSVRGLLTDLVGTIRFLGVRGMSVVVVMTFAIAIGAVVPLVYLATSVGLLDAPLEARLVFGIVGLVWIQCVKHTVFSISERFFTEVL